MQVSPVRIEQAGQGWWCSARGGKTPSSLPRSFCSAGKVCCSPVCHCARGRSCRRQFVVLWLMGFPHPASLPRSIYIYILRVVEFGRTTVSQGRWLPERCLCHNTPSLAMRRSEHRQRLTQLRDDLLDTPYSTVDIQYSMCDGVLLVPHVHLLLRGYTHKHTTPTLSDVPKVKLGPNAGGERKTNTHTHTRKFTVHAK